MLDSDKSYDGENGLKQAHKGTIHVNHFMMSPPLAQIKNNGCYGTRCRFEICDVIKFLETLQPSLQFKEHLDVILER